MVNNVLLITIDSLRMDIWREMMPSLVASPNLEETGVSFDRAFATGPGTTSSFPGLLTGTYPLSHGGLGPLNSSRPRTAQLLREEGLVTGGFHSNPFLSTSFNYDVGFDAFTDYQHPLMGVATKVFPRGIELNNPVLEKIDSVVDVTGAIKTSYQFFSGRPRPYVPATAVTDDSMDWIADTTGPFFCWTHYMDVHHPCHPPDRYRDAFGVADVDMSTASDLYERMINRPEELTQHDRANLLDLYRAAIKYVDEEVERLVQLLKTQEVYEDTLIILTSDHGELFGERGQFGKPPRMFDELIHVPLVVVNGPSELEAAKRSLVSLLDVPPMYHRVRSRSSPAAYEGVMPGDDTRDYVLAEHAVRGDPVIGVRSDRWLYEIDEIHGERHLIDVDAGHEVDPQRTRSDDEATMVREVAVERLRTIDPEAVTDADYSLDEDVEERLTHLGYR